MDILWGAWVREIILNEKGQLADIIGIYDEIWKEKKGDFPFFTDLRVVLACQAEVAEFHQTFKATLNIIDLAGISILSVEELISINEGDSPFRWYVTYEFKDVEIPEPGYYELSILIEGQFKQRIPLWVITPKMIIHDPEKDSITESWPEDYQEERQ